jgi:hypothetical protein
MFIIDFTKVLFDIIEMGIVVYLYNLFSKLDNKINNCIQKQKTIESLPQINELIASISDLEEEFIELFNELDQQVNTCTTKQKTLESINNVFSNQLLELFDLNHNLENKLYDLQNTLKIKNSTDTFENQHNLTNELNDKYNLLFKEHECINIKQTELVSNVQYLKNEIDKTNKLIYTQNKVLMNDINSNMFNLFNSIKCKNENIEKLKSV